VAQHFDCQGQHQLCLLLLQGMIQQMVMSGTNQQQQPGAASNSGGGGNSMLREATPLMSRLEDVANSIGGVGLAAAVGVLLVNSGLYTAELLGSGLSPFTSSGLEVSDVGGFCMRNIWFLD
jgi:hypothetical protein